MKRYLLEVTSGVEINVRGPYDRELEFQDDAKVVHQEQDGETDSLFWLEVEEDGAVKVGEFGEVFFEEGDEFEG